MQRLVFGFGVGSDLLFFTSFRGLYTPNARQPSDLAGGAAPPCGTVRWVRCWAVFGGARLFSAAHLDRISRAAPPFCVSVFRPDGRPGDGVFKGTPLQSKSFFDFSNSNFLSISSSFLFHTRPFCFKPYIVLFNFHMPFDLRHSPISFDRFT